MTPEELGEAGLRYDVSGVVATVTLDRPEVRNAQTPRMWRTLAAIGDRDPRRRPGRGAPGRRPELLGRPRPGDARPRTGARRRRGVGRGPALPAATTQISETIDAFQRGFTWLRDPRFVSVAVVQGHAIGAGFQLALSCDLRVVADDVSFCMKESALGLVPDLTGTKPLVDSVGYARALEICATARMVGAAEALQIGLATVVCPVAELDAATADLVAALTAPLPGAVRETKALLLEASGRTLDEQRRHEREAQTRRFRELSRMMSG